MSLYKYKKDIKTADVRQIAAEERKLNLETEERFGSNDVNLWNSTSASYGLLQKIVDISKITNFIVPLFFIGLGLLFIFKHFSPKITTELQEYNGLVAQGTTAPVSDNYIDLSKYISNPAGLDVVSQEAFEQHVLQDDTISKEYRGTFYLTIPSLGMERLPVQANVDSTSENAYLSVLNRSLAHFENTGLPISDIKNNIVVYGHSASQQINPSPSDPMIAFSFLPNLKVGDDIYIDMEGQRYHFKMSRSKIVEPTDLSIINGSRGKRTLTLFTCYPIGNNSHRYVAIAREV